MKAKSNKAAKRRIRLILIALLLFLGWAGTTLFEQSRQLDDQLAQLAVLEKGLAEVKQQNEQYRQEVERLNDPEYIEQRIRKDLHMVKEGETLFIRTR